MVGAAAYMVGAAAYMVSAAAYKVGAAAYMVDAAAYMVKVRIKLPTMLKFKLKLSLAITMVLVNCFFTFYDIYSCLSHKYLISKRGEKGKEIEYQNI